MKDRKSWSIKGEAILDDLIQLVQLTDDEIQALSACQEQAKSVAAELVEAFYGRLSNHGTSLEFVEGKVDQLKMTLDQWFVQIFSGDYGTSYVQSRLTIGQVHVKIGLPVRYPLAMMDLVMEHGQKVAAQSSDPELAAQAFRKLAALDIAVFNQAYEDTQLGHLTELIGNERLARQILSR